MSTRQQNQKIYREEYKLVFEGCKFAASLRFVTAAFAISIGKKETVIGSVFLWLLPVYWQLSLVVHFCS